MNALTISIAVAALLFAGTGRAADNPSPTKAIIKFKAEPAPQSELPKISQAKPIQGKVFRIGRGEFEIEITDNSHGKSVANEKSDHLPGKPAEPTTKPRTLYLFTEELPLYHRYWIGLNAEPLSSEQQKESKIEGERGLAVEYIVPDSPAAKAGLKLRDILLTANKAPLNRLADLADAVHSSKDQDIALEVQRDGKTQTIGVKPAKRPDADREAIPLDAKAVPSQAAGDFWRILAPGIALGQSLAGVQSGLDNHGLHANVTIKASEQIKALLEQRRELQQQAKDLNKKLNAIGGGSDAAVGETARDRLHDVLDQIEAMNRQIVALEQSRGAPDRDALRRQLSTFRHCASELAEAGRTEEAAQLISKAHDMEERLEALDRDRAGPASARMVVVGNPTAEWQFQRPDADQIRLSQIQTAMQLLTQAGLREDAEHLRQKAEGLEQELKMKQQRRESGNNFELHEQQMAQALSEVHAQLVEMHREIEELRQAVSRMSEQKR